MSPLLTYAGLSILMAVIVGIAFRCIDQKLEEIFPPSPEEAARREAERLAKLATKEFKKRQRLRTVRFWNF